MAVAAGQVDEEWVADWLRERVRLNGSSNERAGTSRF